MGMVYRNCPSTKKGGGTMKIVNTAPMPAGALQRGIAARLPEKEFSVVEAHRFPEDRLADEVSSADLLLGDYTGGTPISRRIVEKARRLKFIQQPSVGYNTSMWQPVASSASR
jgi:phosphoglycerate dehydrogenase-like enzyme